MKIKSLQNVLCVILAIFAAQQTSQAEEPVSSGISGQTLFAYRSSFWAFVRDSLLGYSELPSDLPVVLSPVDPSALQHATLNSTVTFRVLQTATDGHVAYAYGGTQIEAKVTRIREGRLRVRRGKMEPRVMDLSLACLTETQPTPPPGSIKLRLESSPRSRFSRRAKHLAALPLRAIGIVVITVPEDVLLAIFCSTGGCDL
jgi:hypothetical protein